MNNSPRPLFVLHQTLQLALCIGAGVLLASANPRLVRRTARGWSVIHHSREHVFTAPESNSELYTPPDDAWHCIAFLGLCSAARPWKPISWSSQRNSYWADVASRGSLELSSECDDFDDRWFLRTMRFSTSAVPFCDLVWPTTSRLSCCCS
jgi:hypothetical protein